MHIVSVMNYKGGVGKTTLTANIAAELAWNGKSVLLLDMDPQTSLTFSLIRPEIWESQFAEKKTIKSWFDALLSGRDDSNLRELVMKPARLAAVLNGRGTVELIPSHLGLINVDLELAAELRGTSLRQIKVHS